MDNSPTHQQSNIICKHLKTRIWERDARQGVTGELWSIGATVSNSFNWARNTCSSQSRIIDQAISTRIGASLDRRYPRNFKRVPPCPIDSQFTRKVKAILWSEFWANQDINPSLYFVRTTISNSWNSSGTFSAVKLRSQHSRKSSDNLQEKESLRNGRHITKSFDAAIQWVYWIHFHISIPLYSGPPSEEPREGLKSEWYARGLGVHGRNSELTHEPSMWNDGLSPMTSSLEPELDTVSVRWQQCHASWRAVRNRKRTKFVKQTRWMGDVTQTNKTDIAFVWQFGGVWRWGDCLRINRADNAQKFAPFWEISQIKLNACSTKDSFWSPYSLRLFPTLSPKTKWFEKRMITISLNSE
jgi:hypothetical protein